MRLLNTLFKSKKTQPEEHYIVTITSESVIVDHPKWPMGTIKWRNINTILLINTNEGPWLPDVWLTLIGNNEKCMIPQGAAGFEEVYNIVSKYDGFKFENVVASMSCTDNAEFLLWKSGVETPGL